MYTFNAIVPLFFFFPKSYYNAESVYENFLPCLSRSLSHIRSSSLNFSFSFNSLKMPFSRASTSMLSNPTCNSCSVYLTLQELLSKLTFFFSLNPTFFWLLSYYRPSVLPLSQELGPSLLVVLDFHRSNRFPTESPRWPRCILLGKRVKKCTFPNSNLENKRSHLKYIELKAEHLAFLLCVSVLPCSILLNLI